MDILFAASRPTIRANSDYFTGAVFQDPIIDAPDPARLRGARVSFEPGARTNWHTHPLGQTLYVTDGIGRVQTWGGPVRVIRPGDTIWIPPGEKHWHGAAPDHAMVHLAFHENLDGIHINWMEPVADADYLTEPTE